MSETVQSHVIPLLLYIRIMVIKTGLSRVCFYDDDDETTSVTGAVTYRGLV